MENSILLSYMEKVINNVDQLKKRVEKISSENSIICFRGEEQDYGNSKFKPSFNK